MIVRQQPQEQPAQVPVQDVTVQYVEVPTFKPKPKPVPDPSTYMVLSTRKIDGVAVQTVSDRKTGNIYVITLE